MQIISRSWSTRSCRLRPEVTLVLASVEYVRDGQRKSGRRLADDWPTPMDGAARLQVTIDARRDRQWSPANCASHRSRGQEPSARTRSPACVSSARLRTDADWPLVGSGQLNPVVMSVRAAAVVVSSRPTATGLAANVSLKSRDRLAARENLPRTRVSCKKTAIQCLLEPLDHDQSNMIYMPCTTNGSSVHLMSSSRGRRRIRAAGHAFEDAAGRHRTAAGAPLVPSDFACVSVVVDERGHASSSGRPSYLRQRRHPLGHHVAERSDAMPSCSS